MTGVMQQRRADITITYIVTNFRGPGRANVNKINGEGGNLINERTRSIKAIKLTSCLPKPCCALIKVKAHLGEERKKKTPQGAASGFPCKVHRFNQANSLASLINSDAGPAPFPQTVVMAAGDHTRSIHQHKYSYSQCSGAGKWSIPVISARLIPRLPACGRSIYTDLEGGRRWSLPPIGRRAVVHC